MVPQASQSDINPISENVTELRRRFFSQYADAHCDKYDPRDVARVRESDTWLQHFILHQKENVQNAAKMMDSVLTWRKDFGMNDITEDKILLELRQRGALFLHNKNLSGNDIFHFRVKLNKKVDVEMSTHTRWLLAYTIDQYQRRNPLKRMAVVLDLTDVGLGNVDLELTKFLVTCFTLYFPGMLEYLLVYDMPWIVSAIWTLIKQMLSEDEQKHVIFCKKGGLTQYIDRSQLFPHMGGTDTYVYTYTRLFDDDDEVTDYQDTLGESYKADTDQQVAASTSGAVARSKPEMASGDAGRSEVENGAVGDEFYQSVSESVEIPGAAHDKKKKQVNWAQNVEVKEFTPPPTPLPSGDSGAAVTSQKTKQTPDNRITILPTSELQFTRPGINHDAPCSIKLTNECPVPLAYKVKTTDPKNYRVKQGRGILQTNHSETVNIVLLAGKEIKSDKFLILSTKLESADMTQSELAAFWKTVQKNQIHEHKLRCHETVLELHTSPNHISAINSLPNGSSYNSVNHIARLHPLESQLLAQVEKCQVELEQTKQLLKVVLSLLVLLLALVIFK